jgi:phosphoadenosine phosphosulfate reductase
MNQTPLFDDTTSPESILRWAAKTYGDRLAVVTSFQPTGIVILHMLQGIAPQTAVLTLDTGLLFPETYDLIDEIERRFHLRLTRVRPEERVLADEPDIPLYTHDPDRCCHLRKVAPLNDALRGYGAWITGLRRDQSESRSRTPLVGWDARHELVKLSPLACWTEAQVWDYLRQHDLPFNTLHDRGFTSIGCWPCTQAVPEGASDLRAGRWVGTGKTECGIHLHREKQRA